MVKKFLLLAAVILAILFILDITVLKEKGVINQAALGKYEKIENPDKLPEGIEQGSRAPDFTLTDLRGETLKLSDYRGKKVLLNFWATWCPPCKAEMPYMQKFYEKYKSEGFEVLAVNMTVTEKSREDVVRFVEEHDLTFRIPMDDKNQVFSHYEIMAYPTSFFIDSDGVIRSVAIGGMTEEFIERELKKLP
ncbi:thiol:disulfide interchange protein [Mesobacillus campisalis]|uniref:Thiol:disulfide interchange protein n=1 Tax=Mesobacillus campisalis TaxID=1408103 RepID=A0A0M2SWC9_9BACI|nr:thiol:disulfide interchange protein [Mesobacillus campisalis]